MFLMLRSIPCMDLTCLTSRGFPCIFLQRPVDRVVGARHFSRHVSHRRLHVPRRSDVHIRSESKVMVSENRHK